tara:strand:- start:1157 stop:1435 length:279 start_codon:yes stop_codon:yes gene_type:complete
MAETLKHRQSEPGCFSSAGLRSCHDIPATDHCWNGLFLNRRRVTVPLVPQRFEKRFPQPKVIEADLMIDRDSGLADRGDLESFSLEGSQLES